MDTRGPDDLGYRLWMTTLRWLGRVLLHLGYRLRVEGTEHVPREGGVLVVSNHTAFHDWLFVGAALDRPPRFVMHQHHHQYPLLRAFFGASRVIPIAPKKEDPTRLAEAMAAIDRALGDGELVVIFPEGAVSGLFGSSFSRAHGAPMSRWSGRVRAPVTVRFGAPLPADHVDVPTLARELSRLGGQSLGGEARAWIVPAATAATS
jgi:1-acyl-sn-glycerol-3-phosphate acyltransferase